MAIAMRYFCAECDLEPVTLNEAQAHADDTGHRIDIEGELTSSKPVIDIIAIDKAAKQRALDAAILRAARDRNLLPKGAKV